MQPKFDQMTMETSPVPELHFLPAPYSGRTRAGEKRVQNNLHAHAQNAAIFSPQIGEKPYLEVLSRFGLWRDFLNNNIIYYLFFSSWAGGIQQIQQSDWFLERAEFSSTDQNSGRNPSSWSIFVHELAFIVNLSPFLHFHRRLINASLFLFTFKWQGKLL